MKEKIIFCGTSVEIWDFDGTDQDLPCDTAVRQIKSGEIVPLNLLRSALFRYFLDVLLG